MILIFVFLAYAIALSIALAFAGYRSTSAGSSGASATRAMRVLIIGATGGTGRQLVAQALERGLTVTALIRNPKKISDARVKVVQGDVLDYATVEEAMRGQEAVLSALGHKRYFIPTRILSDGTRNLLRAMETHGVQRFVCETSLGIGDSAGRMGLYYTFFVIPVILQFYFWDKTRQERAIAASKVEWTIVRPGALTNGKKRGTYRHGRIGNFLWTVRISRADVADFMLNQLTSDTYLKTAAGACY